MSKIHLLSQDTINKIAAGEVIERPMAVAKELVENAIDAKATAITVEVQDGGKSLIRITDNGSGLEEEDIALAFMPHATSKIQEVTDLLEVSSLGFRGEALSSIASVSQLEMITKTRENLMGFRYLIDGGKEKGLESVGCPDGTTFLVRNLFYNTPARLKFLKTAQTEAGYINGMMERMALSHPEISFRFINQKQTKLSTAGNGKLKDVIYHIYGREITSNLIEVSTKEVFCEITGYIGKPVISRGNRSLMNYFINGRYIKSPVIQKAIEEAYAQYTMQHRYPFTALHLTIEPKYIDVNVHPQKMEIRFNNEQEIFHSIYHGISEALKYRELIPEVTFSKPQKEVPKKSSVEPFELKRQVKEQAALVAEQAPYLSKQKEKQSETQVLQQNTKVEQQETKENKANTSSKQNKINQSDNNVQQENPPEETQIVKSTETKQEQKIERTEKIVPTKTKQETLFEEGFLSEKVQHELKIIGQVFSTYWIVQYEDKMYMIDQHAAHEKVLYERFMRELENKKPLTQMLQPAIVLSLSMIEQEVIESNMDIFSKLGYQIENFGGREYTVTGVPAHLPNIGSKELLIEIIDSLVEENGRKKAPEVLLDRIATMSCKAAVKGNNRLPMEEIEALLKELMTLENPYHCPHGRPTMISMSKAEIEKKFKRIV